MNLINFLHEINIKDPFESDSDNPFTEDSLPDNSFDQDQELLCEEEFNICESFSEENFTQLKELSQSQCSDKKFEDPLYFEDPFFDFDN